MENYSEKNTSKTALNMQEKQGLFQLLHIFSLIFLVREKYILTYHNIGAANTMVLFSSSVHA